MAEIDSSQSELPIFRIYNDPWLIEIVEPGEVTTLGDIALSLYGLDDGAADYFMALQSMTPPDSDFDDATIDTLLNIELEGPAKGHDGCFEFAQIAKDDAVLGAVSGGLLVGFLRDGSWKLDHLAFQALGKDFIVDHVAEVSHSRKLIERTALQARASLTARDFWDRKDAIFPNLKFGLGVEGDLKRFSAKMLKLLFLRLSDLDERVSIWRKTGNFPKRLPVITGESEGTMAKFEADRRFKDSSGNIKTFEDHIWIDGLHRIHLIKVNEDQSMEIGYVGRHLPTVNYRT